MSIGKALHSSRLIALSLLLTVAAGIGLWLESQVRSPVLQAIVGLLCLAAFGTAASALAKRLSTDSHRLPVRALWKFAISSALIFTLVLGGSGTWLAYSRASDIVRPSRVPVTRVPESAGITDYQEVSFPSSDGLTLRGWYIPTQNGAVVIFVHGLGSNRGMFWDDVSMLHRHGYGMLLFDLRNSGVSDGEITTMGLQEARDVDGAVAFVISQPGVDADKVAVFGHSMGGATAILAAARNPAISAVIAQSAYTSLEDNVSASIKQLTGLPAFPFAPLVVFFGEQQSGMQIRQVRPIDDIGKISPRPVLLVHGAQDNLVPVSNVYQLYEAAAQPKEILVIRNAGHGGFLQASPDEYERRVTDFLQRALFER
ncbi:MAG: alpha/beta fold hydrolase [Anaerolineales bacterium]